MKLFCTPLVLGVIAQALLFTASLAIAADVNEHSIKLGYGTPAEHPIGQGINKFAELVGQKSGGKIKIRTYPASQLGSDTQMISATQGGVQEVVAVSSAPQMISATQGGVQEVVAVSSAPLVGMVREFALFDFPFLFANEEADAVLDGPVGRRMFEKLADKGLIGLCFFENGFRNVTNSRRPIVKMDDIAGLKIRTIQSPVYLETFNTLGANAVPMPFPEVYTALETRTVDGQENPYANIHASKYYEVQKYLSATKHAYGPLPVMVSGKFWDKLTPQEKTILQDSCAEARQHQRRVNRDQSAALLADLKAKGMTFNEVAPEEIARMRQKLKPIVDKYTKEVGEDLVKQTYAEIEKLKEQK